MAVLHNVRVFLGFSPQDGDGDPYHFGIKDDDTGALYFDDEEEVQEQEVDLVEQDSAPDDVEVPDDTEGRLTYGYDYEAEEDASVEITFEDGSKEIRIIETELPKKRSKRPRRESQYDSSLEPSQRGGGHTKRPRANPEPTMALQEARPKIVQPRSFADAQTVADGFKAGVPIVMNLTSVDQELTRRLIDFASGFCYVAGGEMERIRSRVFLLTPDSAMLSKEDRRLLASRRYDR